MLPAMLSTGSARAQDWALGDWAAGNWATTKTWINAIESLAFARSDRESARTSALHNIAVIQASNGDVEGAKDTVSLMVNGYPPRPSEVTVVWFCNGQPIYDHPPQSGGAVLWQDFLNHDRAADRVPSTVPAGLPANYLAAAPRHGALVEFTDEYDSRGTRVTSRKYADGSVVIETPRLAGS